MDEYKSLLLKLHQNLNTLEKREVKYGTETPLVLLNQIADPKQAIALTEQVINGKLTETAWAEALKPLLVEIKNRTGEAAIQKRFDLAYLISIAGQPLTGFLFGLWIYLLIAVLSTLGGPTALPAAGPAAGLFIAMLISALVGFSQRRLMRPWLTIEISTRPLFERKYGTTGQNDQTAAKPLGFHALLFGYALIWLIICFLGLFFPITVFWMASSNLEAIIQATWISAWVGGLGSVTGLLFSLHRQGMMSRRPDRAYLITVALQPLIGLLLGAAVYFAVAGLGFALSDFVDWPGLGTSLGFMFILMFAWLLAFLQKYIWLFGILFDPQ